MPIEPVTSRRSTRTTTPFVTAMTLLVTLWSFGVALLLAPRLGAQGSARDYVADEAHETVPADLIDDLEFESLNFSRGGRSTAVAGVPADPLTYYFGGTGGGVWKTTDAGQSWNNVTDGSVLGVGSIGAISVAHSDPNVVYVGTGSACPRGNISNGDGMYRSTDAGKTWKHIGLDAAGQIGSVEVHPSNPDLVYVAALGNLFGPNEERGVYRSRDGGDTWERVLFISDKTGFADLAIDATNPRIIYAAAWRAERKPWTLISGSEEGGLWKTIDGGDTWTKLEGGLPDGLVGKIGVAVSPANPDRVWALVEAEGEEGGLYRSDDAGESFRKLTSDAKLRQRAWYYTHVYADPKDANTVYVLNTGFYRSVDGGQTFPQQIQVPHGDNHDLWINPNDPNTMINANDGGANVSFNGGESWSWQMNQPTAEMYRVFVDNQWPYRVYGPQQDNSTISVPSHGRAAWNRMPPDWHDVGGCESGHIAIDPRDPNIVYAGCYGGSINWSNVETGQSREIIAYPQLQLGQAPRDLEFRFQWNAPIRLSPHDPDVLYHTSQVVHRSTDQGQSWQVISTDLSTNNLEQQDFTGGPITRDSTGVEVYNTIFAFEESPHRRGELWAGTDDGRLHVSRNNGESWEEITPKDLPTGGTINVIDHSAHDPDRVFIAVYRYRENDFNPYVFRTDNGGKSWKLLTNGKNGIPDTHFTRAVREDPDRQGLIYVGTEFGLYVSFDDGENWQSMQSNLPVSPVTDLQVHRKDLVIATQGRSFWILRDLSPLHGLTKDALEGDLHLLEPRVAYRGGFGTAAVHVLVNDLPEGPVTLEFLEGDTVLKKSEWKPGGKEGGGPDLPPGAPAFLRAFLGGDKLELEEGLNSHSWNLRRKAPETPQGVIHWGFSPGVAVSPGEYTVKLTAGDWTQSRTLRVEKWPTVVATQAELEEQEELGLTIAGHLGDLYGAIKQIREAKSQVKGVGERLEKIGASDDETKELTKSINEKLESVEQRLTQVKSKSRQDPLNFPPMLDNQFVEVYANVVASDFRPTAGARQRLADLEPQLEELLGELEGIMRGDVAKLNDLVGAKELPAIVVDSPAPSND